MTTITVEKTISLPKTHFKTIEDFFSVYQKLLKIHQKDRGEVGICKKKDISPELKKKVSRAKTLPQSAFTNI